MVDLLTCIPRMPGTGETLEAPDFEIGCGGKGANLAGHGIDTRHIGTVAGKTRS